MQIIPIVNPLGGGKGSDSEDDEPAAKKKATPALVRHFLYLTLLYTRAIIGLQAKLGAVSHCNEFVSIFILVTILYIKLNSFYIINSNLCCQKMLPNQFFN